MKLDLALIFVHVAANVVWIGSILAVAIVLLSDAGDAKTRGALGKAIYMKAAVPGFVLSFAFGLVRFGMDAGIYAKNGWMHIKLTMALVVIVLHHLIGAKAKKMADGSVSDAGKTGIIATILALCAILAVFFVVMRIPGG